MATQDGPCCWLELCCPPEKAAAALADLIAADFGWSTHKNEEGTGNARAVADWIIDRFRLVPKSLDENITSGADPSTFGKYEALLGVLIDHVDRQLRIILPLAGYSVEACCGDDSVNEDGKEDNQ